ncbi:restriction endonuclease subunit S [Enterobacter cloacae]|uniref:restriction endonuclease subunit S n=1 Tax=Enterobacter cloacae complex TaxID=354276 RepID=UPI0021087CCA|nr:MULTISPECIES: restriction endonuclease subunit S [Enterobacter cloacae complex]MCQ4446492.1 restriction endonuclease subunit S [Enterobacter cloacae]MDW2868476.1 restriction endonuclease subunit S [Enterobacter hormaechei]
MSGGKLPEGWVNSSLGDVLDVNSGVGFPIKFQGKNSGDYPVYKVSDISLAVTKNNGNLSAAGHYISKEEAVELKGKIFRLGSTAFAKIGEAVKLNRRAIVQSPGLADNNVMVISAVLHEMDKFIFHFMNTIDLSEQARSTTVPSIRKGDIENIRLALPSIYEQKIIAEKLDTLLAQVDSTKARLEQIPQILKRFRQAVLSAAVGGKFTTDTGFIQSPLTIGQETSFSPKGWQWHKLTELAQLESGHTPRKTISEYWDNGDIPWISLQDIRAAHGKVIYKTKFMPTQKGIDNSSARLLPEGTVCFSRDISVGYTTIMGTSMATTQHFANWICGKKLNNKYLMFSFMAAKQHLTKSGQGTTVKTIYMPALKELQILIPPLPEQQEIVRRVEQLFAYADTIEKQVNSALTRVNSLTQSILAKAFRGELTAQWRAENPSLISGENSAAALLEKIKAERAASGGKKNSRKKA